MKVSDFESILVLVLLCQYCRHRRLAFIWTKERSAGRVADLATGGETPACRCSQSPWQLPISAQHTSMGHGDVIQPRGDSAPVLLAHTILMCHMSHRPWVFGAVQLYRACGSHVRASMRTYVACIGAMVVAGLVTLRHKHWVLVSPRSAAGHSVGRR